jgi:nucleoid DNA-binding protein
VADGWPQYIPAQERHPGHRILEAGKSSPRKDSQTMATTTMKAPTTKPRTKSELFSEISTKTELSRKQVAAVFEQMSDLIRKDLKSKGIFTVPGLMKIKRITKPARPARKGVPNPFKPGELMDVAAKPARKVVKVQPLKALKTMV